MRISTLLGSLTFTAAVGCTVAECPAGYTSSGDGLCFEDASGDTGAGDTDTGGGSGADTDSGSDTDTDSGNDTDTGDTDSGGDTDTGQAPAYTVCDDGVAPYNDIQSAVDNASDGDTLYVCAGIWGPVTVGAWSPEVTVIGAEGAAVTIIDGGDSSPWTQSAGSYTLAGFTFVGRLGDYEAGVAVTGGSIAISDSVFSGIEGEELGGNDYPSAVYVTDAETVELTNLRIEDNDFQHGVAISLDGVGTATLSQLSIQHNVGEAVFATADSLELHNSIIAYNVQSQGTLLYLPGELGTMWMYNNVIVGNVFSNGSELNTYLLFRGAIDAENNIFADNDGQLWYESGTFAYNLVFGDEAECYGGCVGTGNLTSDPKFLDAKNGDFGLDAGFSPAVNMGNPLAGYNDVDGSRNDMGAFGGPGGNWTP